MNTICFKMVMWCESVTIKCNMGCQSFSTLKD
uniref:Uncharacterized protein n=1 Tax=Anguilla anguilla TaxID=7936 RepID=A0A0E9XRL5_ANGAN